MKEGLFDITTKEEEMTFDITQRIKHTLSIYPGISPTMLQMGLGPTTKAKFWKPILEQLISKDIVVRTNVSSTAPNGRHNSYIKLSLAEHA